MALPQLKKCKVCRLALALWSVYILTTMVVPSSSGRHFFSASNTLSNPNPVHVYFDWQLVHTFEAYTYVRARRVVWKRWFSLPAVGCRCIFLS
jgi:hypothetical protein